MRPGRECACATENRAPRGPEEHAGDAVVHAGSYQLLHRCAQCRHRRDLCARLGCAMSFGLPASPRVNAVLTASDKTNYGPWSMPCLVALFAGFTRLHPGIATTGVHNAGGGASELPASKRGHQGIAERRDAGQLAARRASRAALDGRLYDGQAGFEWQRAAGETRPAEELQAD